MNVFIFSHIADCDGITPIILAKLAFNNVEYKLLDNPIDNEFLEYINNNDFSKYDYIFMTDICINEDTIKKLDDNFIKKFKVFDHHISNMHMNKYDFIEIVDKDIIKQSGTSLFYRYLRKEFDNQLLNKNSVKTIVDIVRLADTWAFVEENKEPNFNLVDFLSILGIDSYIEYFYNFVLNNDEFYLEEKYSFLFEMENKRKLNYIDLKEKQMIRAYLNPYNVGIVFAENYRSLLGNELSKRHTELDFIIIINLSRSISYRTIKDDIDLSQIASIYGGKGHQKAAGSPLPNNLKEIIIKTIYQEAVINEN